jgi:riboflavin biosynthesis pyrimidine reductase
VRHLVCEGGPAINGQLFAEGLVDEVCLSLAPRFVAGESKRIAHGDEAADLAEWELALVLADGAFLFLRYVRPST